MLRLPPKYQGSGNRVFYSYHFIMTCYVALCRQMLGLPPTHLYIPDFLKEPITGLLNAYRAFQRCEMPCVVTPTQVCLALYLYTNNILGTDDNNKTSITMRDHFTRPLKQPSLYFA